MPVWFIKFESIISAENMAKFMNGIISGKAKPKFLPVSEIPAIRSLQNSLIIKKAMELFNEVQDFLIDIYKLYFKEWEYQEHTQKYGTGLEKVEHYKV